MTVPAYRLSLFHHDWDIVTPCWLCEGNGEVYAVFPPRGDDDPESYGTGVRGIKCPVCDSTGKTHLLKYDHVSALEAENVKLKAEVARYVRREAIANNLAQERTDEIRKQLQELIKVQDAPRTKHS